MYNYEVGDEVEIITNKVPYVEGKIAVVQGVNDGIGFWDLELDLSHVEKIDHNIMKFHHREVVPVI